MVRVPEFFLKLFFSFAFGCAGSLLLRGLFSSCSERGLLFIALCRLLIGSGFFCCRAQAPRHRASVVAACGLRSYSSRAPERRLNSCGTRAELPCSMWDPPGSGINFEPPALVGRFFTLSHQGSPKVTEFSRCKAQVLSGLLVVSRAC